MGNQLNNILANHLTNTITSIVEVEAKRITKAEIPALVKGAIDAELKKGLPGSILNAIDEAVAVAVANNVSLLGRPAFTPSRGAYHRVNEETKPRKFAPRNTKYRKADFKDPDMNILANFLRSQVGRPVRFHAMKGHVSLSEKVRMNEGAVQKIVARLVKAGEIAPCHYPSKRTKGQVVQCYRSLYVEEPKPRKGEIFKG